MFIVALTSIFIVANGRNLACMVLHHLCHLEYWYLLISLHSVSDLAGSQYRTFHIKTWTFGCCVIPWIYGRFPQPGRGSPDPSLVCVDASREQVRGPALCLVSSDTAGKVGRGQW